MKFVNRIKEIRETTPVNGKILTQRQLGDLIGRDQSLVSKLEKGLIDFDTSMGDSLSSIFGITFSQLRENITLPPTVVSGNEKFSFGHQIPIMEYIRTANGSIKLVGRMGTTAAYPSQNPQDVCECIEADGRMRPRYRDMEKIYYRRNKRPQIGKDCFVEMKNGEWNIWQFIETTATHLICRDINSGKEWRCKLSEMHAFHEIQGRD